MKQWSILMLVGALGGLTCMSAPVQAGPYANDMAKCLVRSTTDADKGVLVRWMFSAISLNPEVTSMVNLTEQQREKYNKDFATLVMRLLTDACKQETKLAIQYEGQQAIANSFRVLGAVAARGLMSHPSVSAYMAGIDKYLDKKKLEALRQDGK
jgi:hypothetical protein